MQESIILNPVNILRGLLGITSVIGIAYLFSLDRKNISWKYTARGLMIEFIFVLLLLYVPFVSSVLEVVGAFFVKLLKFTNEGVSFLLGPYGQHSNGFSFLFHSLPVLIFFSSIVSLLYYWGIIQKVVKGFSWVLRKFLPISGAEGLVVSGNVFLGMTESPVLIKNYIGKMNNSELFLVLVSGMGTIAGSVMGAFISMLGGDSPAESLHFAKHLISASFLAAPSAIIISKILCPPTEPSACEIDGAFGENNKKAGSALEAISDGMAIGLKLMANIAGMLLVFIAFIALLNYFTEGIIGEYTGLNPLIERLTDGKSSGLTIEFMLGLVFAPLMWLIGVPIEDVLVTGSLLGQKTILNEFVAYSQMAEWKSLGLFTHMKSITMTTYLLCGFANISSIGILLGGIGILAPEKRPLVAKYGFRALVGGLLVSVLSATLIGMFY